MHKIRPTRGLPSEAKGQTHVFLSLLFKNTVFYDKRIRRPLLDLPLVEGLKARPDKENPGPPPLPGKSLITNCDGPTLYFMLLGCMEFRQSTFENPYIKNGADIRTRTGTKTLATT